MENSSKKQTYIIVGIVLLVIGIPVLLGLVVFLAGVLVYVGNAPK